MEIFLHWVSARGFDLLGAVGIIASLSFTAVAFMEDRKSRHISNLLALNSSHREIWTAIYERPELSRILEPAPDLQRKPITTEEVLFVTFLLLHLDATWQVIRSGLYRTNQNVREDVRWFFRLPIPHRVWEGVKSLQDPEFTEFMESSLR